MTLDDRTERYFGLAIRNPTDKDACPVPKGGVKFDKGKLDRWDLMPVDALTALAELYGTGAKKYGDRNMELGMNWGRVFRAMIGHAYKWWRGERFDKDDGQHHLTSVAWCALTLFEYDMKGVGEDTRSKPTPEAVILPSVASGVEHYVSGQGKDYRGWKCRPPQFVIDNNNGYDPRYYNKKGESWLDILNNTSGDIHPRDMIF